MTDRSESAGPGRCPDDGYRVELVRAVAIARARRRALHEALAAARLDWSETAPRFSALELELERALSLALEDAIAAGCDRVAEQDMDEDVEAFVAELLAAEQLEVNPLLSELARDADETEPQPAAGSSLSERVFADALARARLLARRIEQVEIALRGLPRDAGDDVRRESIEAHGRIEARLREAQNDICLVGLLLAGPGGLIPERARAMHRHIRSLLTHSRCEALLNGDGYRLPHEDAGRLASELERALTLFDD